MQRLAIIAIAAVALGGCEVRKSTALQATHAMGFTQVELGGNSWFGCSDKEGWTRTFEATGANGTRVKGAVCKGLLKGATVRITGPAS
jgi:hypothetical protein